MSKKFSAADMDLPTEINPFAWIEWCEDRKERRKPLTQRAAIMTINKLLPFSYQEQATAVAMSIECGWAGLFPKRAPAGFIERIVDRSWADEL
jgi:hypothetical protein